MSALKSNGQPGRKSQGPWREIVVAFTAWLASIDLKGPRFPLLVQLRQEQKGELFGRTVRGTRGSFHQVTSYDTPPDHSTPVGRSGRTAEPASPSLAWEVFT